MCDLNNVFVLFSVPTAARTVDELTEVCKGLSKQEVDESSDDEPVNIPVTSDDEEKDNFIRHPFQVKERPASIVVNIQVINFNLFSYGQLFYNTYLPCM